MATTTGFNHILATQYRTQAGSVAEVTETINGDGETNIDETVPAGTTDYVVNVAIATSQVQSLVLWAGGTVTVTTNSPTDDTFNLTSSHPLVWNRNASIALPLTTDVASLHISNAGTNPVRVRMSVLLSAHA
jgi:hypothetical protein